MTLARTQVDLIFEQLGYDAEAVLQEIINLRSDGLWQLTKEGPLQAANDAIAGAFGFDISAISSGQTTFRDTIDGFFNPDALGAALTAPGTEVLDQLAGIPEGTGAPVPSVAAINRRITPQLRKSPRNAGGDCETNLIYATAGTVSKVAAGAVTESLKKVSAAHSLFVGLANQTGGGFIEGLFFVALSELDTAYSLEAKILRNMRSQIDRVNEAVENLEDIVFDINHDEFLRQVDRVLRSADLRFAGVQSRILSGQRFSEGDYDAAKALLQQAEDLLCNEAPDPLLTFSVTPYVLLAQIEVLQVERDAWMSSQGTREEYGRFLAEWRTKLNQTLRTDNFLAPVLDLIRCRIRLVLQEIQATIGQGDFLVYFAKEKKWCLELKVLIELVRSSEEIFKFGDFIPDLNDDLREFTDNFQLRPALVVPAQTLAVQIDRYLKFARQRLTDPALRKEVVIGIGIALQSLITQRISALEAQKGPLLEALGLADSESTAKIAQAKQYIEFLSGTGLTELATAAIHGDWETFYSASPVNGLIKDKLGLDLEQLKECFLGSENNEAVADQLDQFNEQTRQQARSGALAAQYGPDSKEQYIDQVLGGEVSASTINIDSIASQGEDLFGPTKSNPLLKDALAAAGLPSDTSNYDDLIPVDSAGSYGVVEEDPNPFGFNLTTPPTVTTGDLYNASVSTPPWWSAGLKYPLQPSDSEIFTGTIPELRRSYTEFYTNLLTNEALSQLQGRTELTASEQATIANLASSGIQF